MFHFRPLSLIRSLSATQNALIKANKLPPRPKINESEITEAFLKGGQGPGGQKINKCNSKVQLKHIPTGIVVTCQATRSQEQNRKKAREILAMKVQHHYNPENSRETVLKDRRNDINGNKFRKAKKKYLKLDEERAERENVKRQEEEELLRSMLGVQLQVAPVEKK